MTASSWRFSVIKNVGMGELDHGAIVRFSRNSRGKLSAEVVFSSATSVSAVASFEVFSPAVPDASMSGICGCAHIRASLINPGFKRRQSFFLVLGDRSARHAGHRHLISMGGRCTGTTENGIRESAYLEMDQTQYPNIRGKPLSLLFMYYHFIQFSTFNPLALDSFSLG
jgi:hypothetical protein